MSIRPATLLPPAPMAISRRRVWKLAEALFGVAVIVGIGYYFARTLSNPEVTLSFQSIHWHLLLPAAALYLLTHSLWGTFWWQLLRDESQPVAWPRTLATYFVSQFGKYVPGKAWVIILRVAMLGCHGASRRAVGVTGIFETLTSMAAGALMGVAALPASGLALPEGAGTISLFAVVAGVPIGIALLAKIAQRIVNKRKGPDAPELHAPSIRLLTRGLIQASFGWMLLAVSLQFAIGAVRGEAFLLTRESFLANLAAIALSYVAGFVILVSPGGLGVREWVLSFLIAARWGGTTSALAEGVVIALVLRFTWTVAEVLLAGSLWLTLRRRRHGAG